VKKQLLTLILAFTCTATLSQISLNPNIAILDLAGKGVDSINASVLSEKLRGEFINSKQFQVIERSAVEVVLKEQGLQQSGCTSTECVAEAGKLLGVKYMVIGSIGKIEQTYLLSVRLINATNGKIEASAQNEVTGSLVQMLKTGIPDVVSRICGQIRDSGPPTVLFSEKPDPPQAKAEEKKRSSPPQVITEKKSLRLILSGSFGSCNGAMEISGSIPDTLLNDTVFFRTNGINGAIGLLSGNNRFNLLLSLGASQKITLKHSGHVFQRFLGGLSLQYYYEGFSLFHKSVVLAPGISGGYWRIIDKGSYFNEPGKTTTINFVRFLSPLFKAQTNYQKLNFFIEYSLLVGSNSNVNAIRWVHSDGQEDFYQGTYTIGAAHLISVGFQYTP
jgi:TolB-like protein